MAFSKAKITRFNEIEGCAPPPGSYNPKLETKLIGGVLSTTQRFLDFAEEHGGLHNVSKCSSKSSTDDVSKTPKTPKYLKPAPRSLTKSKKASSSSLQDLSKSLKSRLTHWLGHLQMASSSAEFQESLQEVVAEFSSINETPNSLETELPDIHLELLTKQRELSEAELTVDRLRDQLGDAVTNLRATQDLADQSELSYQQLQEKVKVKEENYERIIAQLQSHLNVFEEDKAMFQQQVQNAENVISQFKSELNEVQNNLMSSENAKLTLQEQLLQKCDLLEEFLCTQEQLQIYLQEANHKYSEAEKALAMSQESSKKCEEEMTEKFETLKMDYDKASELIRVLHLQLAEADQNLEEVSKARDELNEQLQAKVNIIVLLQEELENAREVLKSKDDDLNTMSVSLVTEEQAKNHVLIQLKDLGAKYAMLEICLAEKIEKIALTENDLAEAQEIKGVLQMNLASVESNVSILKEKLQDSEDLNVRTSSLLQQLEKNVASLQTELTSVSGEKEALEIKYNNSLAENQREIHSILEEFDSVQLLLDDVKLQLSEVRNDHLATVEEVQSLKALRDKQIEHTNSLIQINSCLTEQVTSLNHTAMDLSEQLQTCQTELSVANSEIASLNVEIDDMKIEKSQLLEDSRVLQQEMQEALEKYDESRYLVKHLKAAFEQKSEDLVEITSKWKKTHQDLNRSLQSEKKILTDSKSDKIEINTLCKQILQNEKNIHEYLVSILELKKTIEEVKVSFEKSQRQLESLKGEIDEKEAQVVLLQGKLDDSEKAKEKLHRKLTGTKNVNKSTQEKLKKAENEITELTHQVEKLKESEKFSQETASKYREQVTFFTDQIQHLVDEAVIQANQLKGVLQEKEDCENELKQKLVAVEEEKKQVEDQLQNSEKGVETLRQQLAESETTRNELHEQLLNSQSNTSIVQEELMHAKEHLQEHMNQANRNISTLQEQLSLALQETVRLQEESSAASEQVSHLENLLASSEAGRADAEFELETANQLIECLYKTSSIVVSDIASINNDCNQIINTIENKVELLVEHNSAIQQSYEAANENVLQLETEIVETLEEKLKAEDEIHELRSKLSVALDQLFDVKQEMGDLKLNFSSIQKMSVALEEEKKCLEEEYAKAEKEWDQREQELQFSWKLLSDEVKMGEEKQIQLESQIIDLENREAEALVQIKMLKDSEEWAEKRQLELEEALNKLLVEKENLIEELEQTNQKIVIFTKNEQLARAGMEACKDQVLKVSEMLTALREELAVLKQEFYDQDDEITLLEDLLAEKEYEVESLKTLMNSKESELAPTTELKSQLEKAELELSNLRGEHDRRTQLADEMEELLQRKIQELRETREHLNQLESTTHDLNLKVTALTIAEQQAQEEKRAAEVQAMQATKALAAMKEDFSQKYLLTKQRELSEAELTVDRLRDQLGDAVTNLRATQDLADQSELSYQQLQEKVRVKEENYERIIAQLQSHLNVFEEDKAMFQQQVQNAENVISQFKSELNEVQNNLMSSENAKLTLQEQLLQKCDLLEEFLCTQEQLQIYLQEANHKYSEAEKALAMSQESSKKCEEEMTEKFETLKMDYDKASELIRVLHLQLAEADQNLEEVSKARDELNEQLQAKVNIIVLLQEELENAREVLKSKDDDLNTMSVSLVTEEQAKNHVLIQLKDLGAKYAMLEICLAEKIEKIALTENDLAEAQEIKGVLQMNLASVESNVSILKEKLQDSEDLNVRTSSLLQQLEKNVASLQTELTSVSGEKEALEIKYNNSLAENQREIHSILEEFDSVQLLLDDVKLQLSEVRNDHLATVEEVQSLKALRDEQIEHTNSLIQINSCLTEQVTSLNHTAMDLSEQLQTCQTELSVANSEIASLNVEIDDMKIEKSQLLEDSRVLQQEMQEALEKYDESRYLVKQLKEAFEQKSEDLVEITSKWKKTHQDLNRSLQSEKKILTDSKSDKIEINTLCKQILQNEKNIHEYLVSILELKKTIEEVKVSFEKSQRQLESLKGEIDEKEAQVVLLQGKLDDSEKAKEKLHRKLTGTKNVNKSTQEKLKKAENEITELTHQVEKLKESEKFSQETASKYREQVTFFTDQIQHLVDEAVIQANQLKGVLQEKEDCENELKQKLVAVEEEKKQVEDQLQNSEKGVETLRQQLAESETTRNELHEQLLNSQSNTSIVQEELMHAKEHLQEHMNQANRNISTLQEQLSLALQETVRLQEESSAASEQVSHLENLLASSEAGRADAEFELETANQLIECLYKTSSIVVSDIASINNDCNQIINTIENKVELLVEHNSAIQQSYEAANENVLQLETEIVETLEEKLKAEDEIHELRSKLSVALDQLFDVKQEMGDLKLNFSSIQKMSVALEEEKKCLEEEYAKAEKEWDQREQELQFSWKLLSDEVKMGEEKQIQLESQIIDLENREAEALVQIKMLKDSEEWAEKRQLELEEALNKLLVEKENLIEELEQTNQKIVIFTKNEQLARAGMEACKDQVLKVSEMLTALREELAVLKQEFYDQDDEITLLEDLLAEKEYEVESLKTLMNSKESELAPTTELKSQLEKAELELSNLRGEHDRRTQLADEMEELLQRKIQELRETREHLNQLESTTHDLNLKVTALTIAEQQAQEEKRAAEVQAMQATKALAAMKEDFSQKWSTMEDSILNLESVEARNRDLSAVDSSLRTQVQLLDTEANRLRTGNRELRARLAQLERQEARSSGHQNPAQKISYMQHLKEVILKHQQSEEALHERLVASDCRVAELEAELQQKRSNTTLGKSMLQHTTASLAKKTPRAKGKENDRSLLSSMNISRSTTSLVTSTPFQPKVLNQKNH
ncbi:hypothetical protein B566_EDAN012919 [Ephemera danica]|nr:hypothetical protein B566_EDAN012919 [Ephemera danica]